MPKTIVIALLVGVSALGVIAIAAQAHPVKKDNGQEWLSWSPAERNTFINGFITGYLNGSHKACIAADDLFEVGKSHRLEDQPSARCQARLETYSKDITAYTTVITDFYTKHSEYRNIPFFYLLWFLSDSQNKTSDQLYQKALQGEIRTNF